MTGVREIAGQYWARRCPQHFLHSGGYQARDDRGPGLAADVDHPAEAACLHAGQHCRAQEGGGPDVDRERVVPLGQRGRLQRLPYREPSVVDQHIDRAHLGAGPVEQTGERVLVGQVGDDRDSRPARLADAGRHPLTLVTAPRREHHPRALRRQHRGQSRADPRRRASDHRHPVRQCRHSRSPLRNCTSGRRLPKASGYAASKIPTPAGPISMRPLTGTAAKPGINPGPGTVSRCWTLNRPARSACHRPPGGLHLPSPSAAAWRDGAAASGGAAMTGYNVLTGIGW